MISIIVLLCYYFKLLLLLHTIQSFMLYFFVCYHFSYLLNLTFLGVIIYSPFFVILYSVLLLVLKNVAHWLVCPNRWSVIGGRWFEFRAVPALHIYVELGQSGIFRVVNYIFFYLANGSTVRNWFLPGQCFV